MFATATRRPTLGGLALLAFAAVGCDKIKEMQQGKEKPSEEPAEAPEGKVHENVITTPGAPSELWIHSGEISVISVKNGDTDVPATFTSVTGDLAFQDGRRQVGLSGTIQVGLNSFNSGLDLRDTNVKSHFFDVAQHPTSSLVVKSLEGLPGEGVQVGSSSPATLTGELDVYGTIQAVTASVLLSRTDEHRYVLETTQPFEVSIEKLGMAERLKLLMTACNHKSVNDIVKVGARVNIVPRSEKKAPEPERQEVRHVEPRRDPPGPSIPSERSTNLGKEVHTVKVPTADKKGDDKKSGDKKEGKKK
jgi:polyisoprenoid-binding protein YceI